MTRTRVRMGIEGLDEMLGGGLVPGSICAVIGTYGTGKSTIARQFIEAGLLASETCIFISLEEREEHIRTGMRAIAETAAPEHLFVVRLDPTDFNIAASSLKKDIPELISKLGASRIVIDPVSLYEGLYDDPAERRKELFRFFDMMRDLDCTLLLTSESAGGDAYTSRYGLIEYLADTVISLRYVRPDDLSAVHLAAEVVKMRWSAHSREIKPFEIRERGVVVHADARVF
ncbi:MAG: KaiC domain-containing protein [Methanomicrobiales archaeon]|nr:KaiC domain-containing protein [Methanomicrobiales archaeon]